MKLIPLINSKLKAQISDQDYDRVSKHEWRLTSDGQPVMVGTGTTLARFIFDYSGKRHVKYRSRNKLNSQRSNIYICNPSLTSSLKSQRIAARQEEERLRFLEQRNQEFYVRNPQYELIKA